MIVSSVLEFAFSFECLENLSKWMDVVNTSWDYMRYIDLYDVHRKHRTPLTDIHAHAPAHAYNISSVVQH